MPQQEPKQHVIVNGALKPYFRYVCIPGAISLSKHKCNLPGFKLLKTLCNAEKLTMEGLVPLMEDGEQLKCFANVKSFVVFLAHLRP